MRRVFGIGLALFALTVAGCVDPAEVKRELDAANKLWDEGKKGEAVQKYERVIDQRMTVIDKAEQPKVFQRVIEFQTEKGNSDAAKKMLAKALDNNVALVLKEPKALELLAQVKQEREGKKAEEQEQQARREREEKERQARKDAEQRELDTPLKVTAEEMFKDYEENAENAAKKYRAKQQIEVTGTIDKVDRDITRSLYVKLNPAENPGFGVQCFFADAHAEAVGKLRQGERITIKGRFKSKFGNVMLEECELARSTEDTTKPKLSALRKVVDKLATFPGPLTSEDDRKKYNDELRPLVDQFVDMKFDAKANREEAQEIIELYQKRIENRLKGFFANLLEAGVAKIVADLMK